MSIPKTETVIRRRHRIPFPVTEAGDSATLALQLDAVLMSVGWKMSAAALARFALLPMDFSMDIAVAVIGAVRKETGAHSVHNVYFRDFPRNVPATQEFWARQFAQAVAVGTAHEAVIEHPFAPELFVMNLLKLPGYGTYQHTFEEMAARHEALIEGKGDRLTLLHEGVTLNGELSMLFSELALSEVPLPAEDLDLLRELAASETDWSNLTAVVLPAIKIRENKAIVNAARIRQGLPVAADTPTDILRLAAELSGGDVTLATPVRFRSLPRAQRRILLDAAAQIDAAKLADVGQYAEPWKRLMGLLHPYEGGKGGGQLFDVVTGKRRAPSVMARFEELMRTHNIGSAAQLLEAQPGRLFRSLDWLLRSCDNPAQTDIVLDSARAAGERVSGRVLLSVAEHLENRLNKARTARVFVNRAGRAYVTPDARGPLEVTTYLHAGSMLDELLRPRIREVLGPRVVIEHDMMGVALPLSLKSVVPGLGILPRGSVTLVEHDTVAVFCHWMQKEDRTDYDLSVQLLGQAYNHEGHVSWTGYHAPGAVYSGDITDASPPHGATEIISLHLPSVSSFFVMPQINLYCGEGFGEVAEVYAGYMARDAAQAGLPFEARTVRARSDLRGAGNTAYPYVFMRGEDGRWRVKWLHLYARGRDWANTVEANRMSSALLMQGIVERTYLTVGLLASQAAAAGAQVTWLNGAGLPEDLTGPVTYIGLSEPECLPEGSKVITPLNLPALIPG